MRLMPKIISAGFATCALASASMPAFSGNAWADSASDALVIFADAPESARSPNGSQARERG